MGTLKLSILIPAYNVEMLLPRCLDSIVSQLVDGVEVIIVDDGSTDHTFAVAKSYTEKYSNLVVLSKDNEGVGAARNMLLDHAQGEYIWFVDSDDYIEDGCMKFIIEELRKNLEMDMLTVLNNDETKHKFFEGSGERYVLQQLYNGYLWNKIIRRNIIQTNNIVFEPHLFSQEDWLFLMKLFPLLSHIRETAIYAYHYSVDNNSSIMRSNSKEKIYRNVSNSLSSICHFRSFIEQYKGTNIYSAYLSWVNYSASGFLFSLLSLEYTIKEIKEMLIILKRNGLYPVGETNRKKANLFLRLANIEPLFLLMNKIWHKRNTET